jgi:hypothetical protein
MQPQNLAVGIESQEFLSLGRDLNPEPPELGVKVSGE